MRTLGLAVLLAASFGACDYISFNRRVSPDELLLQQEVRDYYTELQRSFAAANPDALADLFDPSITHPMTMDQIREWGKKFFGENRAASFHIDKFTIDELGYQRAVVTLTYRVETPGGKGDFGATERDTLVKRRGRWYVSGWEKVPK